MVLSAHDVAAELRRRMPGLPTVKLHKLLYYCQGHHLADLGEPLFAETVTAWDMGPVVGELRRAEKDGETPPEWVMTRDATPYQGAHRATRTLNLWETVVPRSARGGRVVHCSY
jgi:hypothetical protein